MNLICKLKKTAKKSRLLYVFAYNIRMIHLKIRSIMHYGFSVTGTNKEIIIDEDSMLSEQIMLRIGDSHAIINEFGIKSNEEESIYIGKHVWIGSGVTILKGVHIGDNCIIGTKSVVTNNIPDFSMAVGIPAKVIKNHITWSRDRYI